MHISPDTPTMQISRVAPGDPQIDLWPGTLLDLLDSPGLFKGAWNPRTGMRIGIVETP